MNKTITIHQPQYLPWIPYFSKILKSDCFVLLDNVSFQKNGVQNRNQIKTSSGKLWLTVPVYHHYGQLIRDTIIPDLKIGKKHLKTIEYNYKKSLHFHEIFEFLSPILSFGYNNLSQLNTELIKSILTFLQYKGEIILASTLNVIGRKSDLIRNICISMDAKNYLSGPGGLSYLNINDFQSHGINIMFYENKFIQYSQLHMHQPFYNDLSILDFLFNVGSTAKDFLVESIHVKEA